MTAGQRRTSEQLNALRAGRFGLGLMLEWIGGDDAVMFRY